jgi:nucleotide-binding universal stress UspA family protein
MFAAFQSILVALDGEQGGLDAAALGSLLTAPGTELTLAHVLIGARAGGEALQTAVNVVRWLRPDLPGAGPDLVTPRAHSVVAGLRELVDTRRVELLVVGAHHHRHLNLASHDHTRDALRHLSVAVAVAPWHYAARSPAAIATVGVGYVDDRSGRVVLDAARGLAWQLGAEMRAMTIVAASNWPDAGSGAGWRALAAARRMAEIPGIHGTAVEGDPYHALLDLSREVDLLVIGTHHRSALHRLLPGDVAEGLAGSARCPLVVVPHNS